MSLRPLLFLAGRYLKSRRRHRGVGAPLLSLLGLAVGVLTLNAVLAVMNGFQLTFIESLMELSSSHLRWTPSDGCQIRPTKRSCGASPESWPCCRLPEGQTLIGSPLEDAREQCCVVFPSMR